MFLPRRRNLPFPSLKPVGFLSGMLQCQQQNGSRKKGRNHKGQGSNNHCAVSNTNTFFFFCSLSFYFIYMVELDTHGRGPLGPVCVPAAAWPQSHQLHHCSNPAGGVASSLVMLRPGSCWPSSSGLVGSPQVGWCQRALPQALLAPHRTLPAPW